MLLGGRIALPCLGRPVALRRVDRSILRFRLTSGVLLTLSLGHGHSFSLIWGFWEPAHRGLIYTAN